LTFGFVQTECVHVRQKFCALLAIRYLRREVSRVPLLHCQGAQSRHTPLSSGLRLGKHTDRIGDCGPTASVSMQSGKAWTALDTGNIVLIPGPSRDRERVDCASDVSFGPPFVITGVNDRSDCRPVEQRSRTARSSVRAATAILAGPDDIVAHTAASHIHAGISREIRGCTST
jgi:hypothetical protein